MIVTDAKGRVLHEPSPATQGLAGRIFRRRSPEGDEGDRVTVHGVIDVGGDGGPCVELVIASTTFGAIPATWDGDASITYGLEEFARDYTELTGAEKATLALQAAAEAKP